MKLQDKAYLEHIRDAIVQIERYPTTHTYDDFLKNTWDQAAIARNLEIIGEAANQLSQEFKSQHSHIPWRQISDFRNVLTHEYFAVDYKLVWEILQKDLPMLKEEIEKLVALIET